MPQSLWEDFEARITAVVRALPVPFPTERVWEAFLDFESLRNQFGASIEEATAAIAEEHVRLSEDFQRWAKWKAGA